MHDLEEIKSICTTYCDPLMIESLLATHGENSYSEFCHLIENNENNLTPPTESHETFMLWLGVCDKNEEYIEKFKQRYIPDTSIKYNEGVLAKDNKWISRCLQNVYSFKDTQSEDYYTFYPDMESAHTAGRPGTLDHMPSSTILCKVIVPKDLPVVETAKNLQNNVIKQQPPSMFCLLGLLCRDLTDKSKFRETNEGVWTADYSKGRDYFGHAMDGLAQEAGVDSGLITKTFYNRKHVPSTQLLVHHSALQTQVQPMAVFTYHGPTIWKNLAA